MGERLTKRDIEKIEEEIEHRKLVIRKEAIEAVKEARAQGDLSENFEYYAAKKHKNQNESRIRYLERMIRTAKVIEVKELRLSPNIDTNDLNTKVNNARKFLEKGDKVKVTLRFRGREMAHMGASKHILDDFAENLKDIASVEKPPKLEGKSMSLVLAKNIK